MRLLILDLGTIDYGAAWAWQQWLFRLRSTEWIPNVLILAQHRPVITLGRRGKADDLRVDEMTLRRQGITVHSVDRGGAATYHGPGQLVGYPIINLRSLTWADQGPDVRCFIRQVEQLFMDMLAQEYDVLAQRDDRNPGVWVDGAKLVSIGFAIRHWVTQHGFAFNVLKQSGSGFRLIHPCGIINCRVATLEELCQRLPDMTQVKNQVVDYFCRQFGAESEVVEQRQFQEYLQQVENGC